MLASVALTLHANPTLPRSLITSVQAATPFLHASNLDTQAELVRFTPITFSLEELSKLWSFLLKIDYVLSTAYVASVVLIETDDAVPGPALPVLSYDVSAQPFALPVIDSIVNAADPTGAIADGATIVLAGTNLAATAPATTQVLVSGVTLTPSAVSQNSITVALPAGAFPPASRRRRSSSRWRSVRRRSRIRAPASCRASHPSCWRPRSPRAASTPSQARRSPSPSRRRSQAGQRVVLQLISQATSATAALRWRTARRRQFEPQRADARPRVRNLLRPRADRRRPQPADAPRRADRPAGHCLKPGSGVWRTPSIERREARPDRTASPAW